MSPACFPLTQSSFLFIVFPFSPLRLRLTAWSPFVISFHLEAQHRFAGGNDGSKSHPYLVSSGLKGKIKLQ